MKIHSIVAVAHAKSFRSKNLRKQPTGVIMRLLLPVLLLIGSICTAQTNSLIVQLNNGATLKFKISEIQELNLSGIPGGIAEATIAQSIFSSFTLYQNYPNPFNPSTTIKYSIPQGGPVAVNIYDVQGKLIRSLDSSIKKAGINSVDWNGKDNFGKQVSSGRYFCRVHFNNNFLTNKLLLVK